MRGRMIASLLIANRGEIARRIIRTARRMGVRTVAVYSDADAERALTCARPTRRCAIGAGAGAESYLRGDAIIAAAKATGAEAIHPGYGFLSENADFAEAVIAAGLVWVGPPPAAIRAMGLKDAAKRLMADAGRAGDARLSRRGPGRRACWRARRRAIGWPVMIKAVAGGGGNGMRAGGRGRRPSPRRWRSRGARRPRPSATTACCLEKLSNAPAPHRGAGVRRQRTATSSTCSSATARCSAATRR